MNKIKIKKYQYLLPTLSMALVLLFAESIEVKFISIYFLAIFMTLFFVELGQIEVNIV